MVRTFAFIALFAATAFAADDYGKSTVAPVIPPPQPGPPYLQLAPMLGHVSPGDARIWIKATGAVKWSVKVSEQADLAAAREVEGAPLSEAFTSVALVAGLKPGTRYFYSVLLDGQPIGLPGQATTGFGQTCSAISCRMRRPAKRRRVTTRPTTS